MDDSLNPIKDIFYQWVRNFGEENLVHGLNKDSSKIISKIISETCPKVLQIDGDTDEKISILTTSMMHYLLTILLISSQRKIIHNGIDVSLAIPNVRKLNEEPNQVLIIDMPSSQSKEYLENRFNQLQKIQQVKGNIWFILNERQNLECKMFCIKDDTFSEIISEINKFLKAQGTNQLKIFKN